MTLQFRASYTEREFPTPRRITVLIRTIITHICVLSRVLNSYDFSQYSCRIIHDLNFVPFYCVCARALKTLCLLPRGAICNRFCAGLMWARKKRRFCFKRL